MNGFTKNHDLGVKGWKVTIFSLLCYYVCGFMNDGMNTLYGYYGGLYGWERSDMAIFMTIGQWTGAVMIVVCGMFLAKRIGPKKMLALGFAGQMVTFFLLSRAQSLPVFASASICNSLSTACITSFGVQLLGANWFPKKKGIFMGICTMGVLVIVMTVNPIIGFFVNRFGTANPYFYFVMAVYAAMLLIDIFAIHDNPEDENAFPDNDKNFNYEEQKKIHELSEIYKKTSPWTVGRVLREPQAWMIGIGWGLINMMAYGINGQIYPALMSQGFDSSYINWFLILTTPFGLAYSWLGGVWDTRFGTKSASLWVVNLVAVIGCALFGFGSGVSFLPVLGMGLALTSCAAGNNMTMSVVSTKFGRYDFANAWTVIFCISRVLTGSGAIVMSKLADLPGGYATAYKVFGLIGVVSFIVILFVNTKTIGRTDEQLKEQLDKATATA